MNEGLDVGIPQLLFSESTTFEQKKDLLQHWFESQSGLINLQLLRDRELHAMQKEMSAISYANQKRMERRY